MSAKADNTGRQAAIQPDCPDCGRPLFTGFEAWYRAQRAPLCRRVAKMLRRGAVVDPEDIVQDTFVDFCRALALTDVKNPGAWLSTVARRKVSIVLRLDGQLTDSDVAVVVDAAPQRILWTSLSATADLETTVAARRALNILTELPNRQRAVSYLFEVQGWRQTEIADFLGIAPGTVGVHMTAARRAMVSRLNGRGAAGDLWRVSPRPGQPSGDEDSSDEPEDRPESLWVWCPQWPGEPQRWYRPSDRFTDE
ncbi:sigma-70 family RNA polymerase sigma factor [Actinoplanes sp. LDG1-06]|uniref:Sigma-70 family RNA polymerase sigma factor n=1 Tax=Paractinoplanes ovalisporus TaxID=2810368 RepID=A0ABS2AU82_9ACTN|nr:sigma-70 family RNA polymerase sigma factor [Actinoplanes ovalisporus]MBM2623417.1 sigma-70 family RNA polymerase sigma factor [Actinoplanes ovalisporus]